MEKPVLGILTMLIIGLVLISGCVTEGPGDGTGFEWFQTGNMQQITQLQTKQSSELEDNHIKGGNWDGLDSMGDPSCYQGALDAIFDAGLRRVSLAVNHLDCPDVDWSIPENSINPDFDNFVTSLADNGVTITYVLSFWDKESHAIGEGVSYPRFKTEDQIQRYLDFVQFIVYHFKDRIQYYEIWNEPNLVDSIQEIEVKDYINLVKRTIPVIHEEYPEAKIVVGATAAFREENTKKYLFDLLESDIMPLVDSVSFHPMYGTSPEYDTGEKVFDDTERNKNYYYEYPYLIQEIKSMASAHDFKGEFFADELVWRTVGDTAPGEPWTYSEIVAAKYYARGIIRHLGMNITVGVVTGAITQPIGTPFTVAIQNLCTIMAGAKPTDLSLEIQSSAENIKTYSFSLTNGDKLIALWTDGVAVDDDPGIRANLTVQSITSEDVTGIDVLNGYQQPIAVSSEDGNLIIQNLIVRDYPMILRIV